MNALEFLRDPRDAATPKPVFVVFGEDAYLRSETLAAIVTAALGDSDSGLGSTRIAGAKAELAAVLDELRTLPFLAPRRVVVVDDADPFVTTYRKELESYLDRPSSTGILILVVKSWPGNTRLAKQVAQVGMAIEARAPREAELPGWLVKLAPAKFDAKIESDAARLLVELVGPEPGLLVSELEKLSIAIAPRTVIQRADVARWVEAGRSETVWEMIDAATMGHAPQALEGLERLLEAGEPPVKLHAAMSVSLLKLYQAGHHRQRRKELREACQLAGIPPFAAEKTGKQHAHLGPARVQGIPKSLLEADLDLKGSSTLDPRTILERLLIRWSTPRAD